MEIKTYDCGVRFATAVECNGMIYTSGLAAADKEGMEAQTAATLEKIDAALEKAGSDKDHILMVNVWVADMAMFGDMNKAYDAWVSKTSMPCRACVESKLVGGLVEIAVVAVKK